MKPLPVKYPRIWKGCEPCLAYLAIDAGRLNALHYNQHGDSVQYSFSCLRGGVKVPTGGDAAMCRQARERIVWLWPNSAILVRFQSRRLESGWEKISAWVPMRILAPQFITAGLFFVGSRKKESMFP